MLKTLPVTGFILASAISGIQETAAKAGYKVMVCHSNESYATEVFNVQALTAGRGDGATGFCKTFFGK